MATYYVRTDGVDTASGANNTNDPSTGAWLTVQKAINTMADGDTTIVVAGTYAPATRFDITFGNCNGKSWTIQSNTGDDVLLASSDATQNIRLTGSNFTSGSYTFRGIRFQGASAANQIDIQSGGTYSLNFINCTFVDNAGRILLCSSTDTPTRTVSFTNCTASNATMADGAGTAAIFVANQTGLITINGGNWTLGGGHGVLWNQGSVTHGGLSWTGSSINGANMTASRCVVAMDTNSDVSGQHVSIITFSNNVVNNLAARGVFVERRTNRCIVNDNVFNSIASVTGQLCIAIGRDGAAPSDDAGAVSTKVEYAQCLRNTVSFANASSPTHGILIGAGVLQGECAYNKTTKGDYGLVAKLCQYVNFHHNDCGSAVSGGIYIRGSKYCTYTHNSFHATGGFGCYIDAVSGDGPAQNTIVENIFVMPVGVSGYAFYHDDAVSIADHYVDGNIYFGGSTGLGRINATICATVETMRTAWAAYATRCVDNDVQSSNVDPKFISSTNLMTVLSSPAIGNVSSRYANKGALQSPAKRVFTG